MVKFPEFLCCTSYVIILILSVLERISHPRSTKISWWNECSIHLILTSCESRFPFVQFAINAECVILLSFMRCLPACFHHGSQVEIRNCLSVKVWLGNDATFSFHTCISNSIRQCYSIFVFYSVSKQGFNGACSNCHCMTLISVIYNIMCAEFIYTLVLVRRMK